MLIVMAGLPGTGKSTIAEVLAGRIEYTVISVDPIEAAILSAGIDAGQPTGLAAYLVAGTLAEMALKAGHNVIIDAVNAVQPAREQWVNLANRMGEPIRFIEVVCTDEELHRSRLVDHTPSGVEAPAVEQSLEEYDEWTGPSAAVGRITLDTVEPIGVNVDRAIAFLHT